jgi:hypothetical protein
MPVTILVFSRDTIFYSAGVHIALWSRHSVNREAVALIRDAESERLAELRENRRGKGLPTEPTDEQIVQIWSDRRLN